MAQNITLMGANYSAVPAVMLPKTGGGQARFTDVTPTDAVEADVASGKVFFKSDGTQATGTASGGGGGEYTRTVIAPQQTVSSSSAMQQITLTSLGLIEDANDYIVTIDNVEWLTTCETLWTANYCIGDVRYFLEASPSNTIYPFGAICESGTIYVCFSTTGSHTIKIERLDFVTGGTTLTTKTITQNGTYNASADNADGYSSVTVNVSGGGGGKNIQYATGRYEISNTAYTDTGLSITVSKAGTYKCYWSMDRNTTSGTSGSRLYKGSTALGTAHTSWTYNNNNRNGQVCEETLTFAANDVITVRARSRSTSYICGVMNFFIVEQ